jgi:type IV pilus assembly protein PilP
MKRALVIALGLFLAACGGGEYQDLKEELKKLTTDMRGKVPPLPVVKPYEPVPYKAFDLPDPFSPAKIELVTKAASTGGGLKPDLNRPKEPLEAFPLESVKVVGMLQQGKQAYALVRADASVYRVKVGSYLGQNFGLITGITDAQVQLRELVQDASGDWAERVSTLQLQEVGGKQ